MAAELHMPPLPDWIHLPAGVEAISLWTSLYDGRLSRVATNALARTATLEFDVYYLWKFHGLPRETRFQLEFEEVSSLRTTRLMRPSVGFLEIVGEEPRHRAQRLHDHHNTWRKESIAWNAWEREVGSGEGYEVSQAELASDSNVASVHIGGFNEAAVFTDIYLTAGRLKFYLNGKTPLTIDEFLEVGGKYWKAFGKRLP